MLHVPEVLKPSGGEAAVLSALAVHEADEWRLVCGSLLTVPADVARTSWKRWGELQPRTRGLGAVEDGFDLGPVFCTDPFPDLRVCRLVVDQASWGDLVSQLSEHRLAAPVFACSAAIHDWSSTVLLTGNGLTEAHDVVAGARRPVEGVVGMTDPAVVPASDARWDWVTPPSVGPGKELAEMFRNRHLLQWPKRLLGIDWLGDSTVAPPRRFVIGRILAEAWIADVVPDYAAETLDVVLCWDENAVDPLGCTLAVRSEHDGLLLMARQVRISDLPSQAEGDVEPRTTSWQGRTLCVTLPRGPRRADVGVMLMAEDGRLLDERPVASRIERIEIATHVGGSAVPTSVSVVGDRGGPPSPHERDAAVSAAFTLESAAREAAAHRRVSTAGELGQYLRWRFSCRAGELLVLDPYLLDGDVARVLEFLRILGRPIRALCRSLSSDTAALVEATTPQLEVRTLPHGKGSLHDRVWIVGETGLLVGSSVSSLLADPGGGPRRATTATELPHADAGLWRDQFESWWAPR